MDDERARYGYRDIASVLRGQIEGSVYPPGSQLPTGAALTAEFNVARDTVRRALELLSEDGLVVIVQGVGSFVIDDDNPSSSLPKHALIATELRQDIASGNLAPGALVPSEGQIQERFKVSRRTARTALRTLEDEGLVRSAKGRRRVVESATD